MAVLSTDILGDRVAAATYDKKVVMLDRREGPRKCSFYKVHSKPVLAVKLSERQGGLTLDLWLHLANLIGPRSGVEFVRGSNPSDL